MESNTESDTEINNILILVKHSLPAIDPEVPANEWHLSKGGRRRAVNLAKRLAGYNPGAIFSSPEPKAVETAAIVAQQLGWPGQYEVVEGLHEHERSQAAFVSDEQFEEAVKNFFAHPGELIFGSETADQAYYRFAQAVSGILEATPGQNPVIVAHGTVITLYVTHILGFRPFDFWQRLDLPSFVVLARPDVDPDSNVIELQTGIGDIE